MFNLFKSQLQKNLDKHVKEMLYENSNVLSNVTSKIKEKMKDDLFELISSIQKINTIASFREKFTESILVYTNLQVICTTDEEKAQMPFASEKKISGKLYKNIKKCVPHNFQTQNILLNNPNISNEECLFTCNQISVSNLFYMNGLNLLRIDIGDCAETHGEDWFQPFITSMLVFSEHTIRKELKLNKLFENEKPSALVHSTFKNFVCDSLAENPYTSWKSYHKLN